MEVLGNERWMKSRKSERSGDVEVKGDRRQGDRKADVLFEP